LQRSVHTTSNVDMRPAASGIIAVIVVECYRRVVAVVAATAVVTTWAFVRWDRHTLERDVASSSVSCPQQEGREEPTMNRMSTIMVKLEHRETTPTWRAKC
jgi:hypothetical protein